MKTITPGQGLKEGQVLTSDWLRSRQRKMKIEQIYLSYFLSIYKKRVAI